MSDTTATEDACGADCPVCHPVKKVKPGVLVQIFLPSATPLSCGCRPEMEPVPRGLWDPDYEERPVDRTLDLYADGVMRHRTCGKESHPILAR